MSSKVMLTAHSLKKYLNQYYSEVLLLSIIFLFFLELVSDFIETIYTLCLLTQSLNENVLSVLFFFSPLILFLFKKEISDKVLVIVSGLMIVCRVLTPLVVQNTQIKMITSGIGVACFLILFPLLLQRKVQGDEELNGVNLGLGLAFGTALSILFRTLGSTIDIATYSWFQVIGWILAGILFFMICGMFVTKHEIGVEDSTDPEGSSSIVRIFCLSLGLVGILIMIYYS
ncbi:MAG: hypothetical protein ACFFC6_16880, partial [Promethearchaeota archaeon]